MSARREEAHLRSLLTRALPHLGVVKIDLYHERVALEREIRQALRCGIQTLCPDDLIQPCVLLAGHEGDHDGGRA